MATNTRSVVKWIRDLAKSHYAKASSCAVCGVEHGLEFHHYNTVSLIVKNYVQVNRVSIDTKEDILAMREAFLKEMWHEMVEDAVTLCEPHHKLLHKLYGKEPSLSSAAKQRVWVEKQRAKFEDGYVETPKERSSLGALPNSLTSFCTETKPFHKFLTR